MNTILSRVVLGTASLGSRASSKTSQLILELAINEGIHTFDTAPLYGAGQALNILDLIGKGHPEIHIYSKYLSSIYAYSKSIARLIYRRCPANAYSNYYDCYMLMKKARRQKICPEDIYRFTRRQKLRYPNLLFKGWFLHSPPRHITENIGTLCLPKEYGISVSDDYRDDITMPNCQLFQASARKILTQDLSQFELADKIFVNRIYSYCTEEKMNFLDAVRYLLQKDPRIRVVISTTSKSKLLSIIKEICSLNCS